MVNSRFTGDDVAETLGIPRERIHVAYPGVDAGLHARRRAPRSRPAVSCSRSRRSSRERTSPTLVEAHRRLDGELALAVAGAAGWGDAGGARRPEHRPARLHAARRAAAAVPRRERRRLPVALRGLRHADRRGDGVRRPRRRVVASFAGRGVRRRGSTRGSGGPRRDRRGDPQRARPATTSSSRRASSTHARSPGSRTGALTSRRGRRRDERRDGRDAASAHARRYRALHPQSASAARRAAGRVRRRERGVGARARARGGIRSASPRSAAIPTCCTARRTTGRCGPRVPTVVTVHDLAVFRHPETFPRWTRTYVPLVVPRVLRAARRVIAVSEFTAAELESLLRVPREKIRVVPNARRRDVHAGRPTRRRRVRARRRARSSRGRISRARSRRPRESASSSASSARAAGAASRRAARTSTWLGEVDDDELARQYRGARCVVYPSFYEGFGLPVLEAMACGAAVVTSAGGATGEVAGDAAVLVDPLDVGSIAAGHRGRDRAP